MSQQIYINTPNREGGYVAGFGGLVSSPGPQVLDGDILIVTLTTSDAAGVAQIRGRELLLNGEWSDFERTITFSGTGAQADTTVNLAGGWIVGFDLSIVSGTITDGEVVASVHVGRNPGSLQQKLFCLASGELTNQRSLGLGAFTNGFSTALASYVAPSTITVTTPAAGAQWSTTVPASTVWEILAIRALLSTSAAVANRMVTFSVTNGATTIASVIGDGPITASIADIFTLAPNQPYRFFDNGTNWFSQCPMYPTVVGPGYVISSNVAGMDAADQWSAIRLTVTARAV